MARISERSTDGAAMRHEGGGFLARLGFAAVVIAAVGFSTGVGLRWIGMLAKPAHAVETPVPILPGCAKKFYDRAPGLPRLDNCLAVPQ